MSASSPPQRCTKRRWKLLLGQVLQLSRALSLSAGPAPRASAGRDSMVALGAVSGAWLTAAALTGLMLLVTLFSSWTGSPVPGGGGTGLTLAEPAHSASAVRGAGTQSRSARKPSAHRCTLTADRYPLGEMVPGLVWASITR